MFKFTQTRVDAGIMVLHWRRDVSCDDFGCVVEEGQGDCPVDGDIGPPEDVAGDRRERVGQDRDLVGVLGDILGNRASHQAPSSD